METVIKTDTYIGLSAPPFKNRYGGHKGTFKHTKTKIGNNCKQVHLGAQGRKHPLLTQLENNGKSSTLLSSDWDLPAMHEGEIFYMFQTRSLQFKFEK